MSGAAVDEHQLLLNSEAVASLNVAGRARGIQRRHVFTAVVLGVLGICAYILVSSRDDVANTHGLKAHAVTQLAEDNCLPVPDECTTYMADSHKCDWTSMWACPDAPSNGTAQDWTGGRAQPDASDGYTCCCEKGLWKSGANNANPMKLCAIAADAAQASSAARTTQAAAASSSDDQADTADDDQGAAQGLVLPPIKASPSTTDCTIGIVGVGAGVQCMFPFTYEGVVYNECTSRDNTAAWCYTTVDSNGIGVPGQWGECTHSCPDEATADAATSSSENAEQASAAAAKEICTTGKAGVGGGQPCSFPFTYKDTRYDECSVVDNTVPWCYVEVNSAGEGVDGKWGECSDGPCQSACTTTGEAGVGPGVQCIFPFTYEGTEYNACTVEDNTVEWCYTAVDGEETGVPGQWGECDASVCAF